MADDNTDESGRKSARAQKAKKRDEDVLEKGEKETKKRTVETSDKTATRRDGKSPRKETGADDSNGADDGNGADAEPVERKPAEAEPAPVVNPVQSGEQWLGELFKRMHLDLDVQGQHDGQNVVFNISGTDADDLIGRSRRSPKLLSAMQTLLVEHLSDDIQGSVLIDVGGFKKKRQAQLIGVADKLAETVRKNGRSLTVAGFDRYERKIIHQQLEGVAGVKTDSVGHGVFRKLRVLAE